MKAGMARPMSRGMVVAAALLGALVCLSSSASATHETDTMSEHVTQNELGVMSYLLFVPPDLPAGSPLFVHVHGGNNAASDAAHRSGLNDLAREYGMAVAYPQEDPGAGNNGIWDSATAADEGRGSRASSLIAQITREVVAEHDLDASRVFIGGISAGSAMALVEAAHYPELYAGLQDEAGAKYGTGKEANFSTDPPGAESEYLLTVEDTGRRVYEVMGERARRIPIIRSTGTLDPFSTQPDQQGTVEHWMVARDWIDDGERNDSVTTTPRSSRTGTDGKDYTVTEWVDEHGCLFGQEWVIEGMFHSYAGGSPTQTGDVTADPDAPDMRRVAIEFFLEQTALDGPSRCNEVATTPGTVMPALTAPADVASTSPPAAAPGTPAASPVPTVGGPTSLAGVESAVAAPPRGRLPATGGGGAVGLVGMFLAAVISRRRHAIQAEYP